MQSWQSLKDWEQDLLIAEQIGKTTQNPAMGQHYTLRGGIRVMEPNVNFGMDYHALGDAIAWGCEPLKPSIFGVSGKTQEEVQKVLEKYKHFL